MFGAVVVLVACAHADGPEVAAFREPGGDAFREPGGNALESPMHAAIEVVSAASGADFTATVTLTNSSASPLAVNTLFFGLPSVSLEVRTKEGASVPKGPPPVPPIDDGKSTRTLAPGESLTLVYRGATLFAVPPPPGDYEVRFRGWSPAFDGFIGYTGPIVSQWASFHVER